LRAFKVLLVSPHGHASLKVLMGALECKCFERSLANIRSLGDCSRAEEGPRKNLPETNENMFLDVVLRGQSAKIEAKDIPGLVIFVKTGKGP
jgi:hypothetical protein